MLDRKIRVGMIVGTAAALLLPTGPHVLETPQVFFHILGMFILAIWASVYCSEKVIDAEHGLFGEVKSQGERKIEMGFRILIGFLMTGLIVELEWIAYREFFIAIFGK